MDKDEKMTAKAGRGGKKPAKGRNADGTFAKGNRLTVKYKGEYCEMMLRYFRNEAVYPTFELFADSIGVTNDTLLNWRDKYRHFGAAYDRCKNIQKGRTIAGGLTGKYNPQIVKFMAINNFGMAEKLESDSTVRFDVIVPADADEEAG